MSGDSIGLHLSAPTIAASAIYSPALQAYHTRADTNRKCSCARSLDEHRGGDTITKKGTSLPDRPWLIYLPHLRKSTRRAAMAPQCACRTYDLPIANSSSPAPCSDQCPATSQHSKRTLDLSSIIGRATSIYDLDPVLRWQSLSPVAYRIACCHRSETWIFPLRYRPSSRVNSVDENLRQRQTALWLGIRPARSLAVLRTWPGLTLATRPLKRILKVFRQLRHYRFCAIAHIVGVWLH